MWVAEMIKTVLTAMESMLHGHLRNTQNDISHHEVRTLTKKQREDESSAGQLIVAGLFLERLVILPS